ncbi:MAG: rhlE [Rickettsiaceae bacterium]|jgi:ATP-dependent RNA helicase RhlE|nr:rhlE [Rickettsiaceae bacterium]
MSDFKNLNLSATILSALTKKGYETPTPIQQQSIPHLLQGKDLLGIAQTGTGKTAAFALPILDNLFKSNNQVSPNHVRALILTPTRELASQIVDNIKLYGHELGLRYAVIFGGVSINNQIKAVKQGVDIIVATPGRLLDLTSQGHLRFSQIEIFVLDEADRMLDMGFIGDVKKIIAKLPKERQTLFFSATMPKDVAVLADAILSDPVKVEVTPQSTTVEKIDQRVNLVEKANKPLLLKSIIEQEGEKNSKSSFLVFSRTKHGANRVVEFLGKHSVQVAAIHGNKSQSAREKALEGFRQGKIKVLVATDIAARGIDIPAITHVINYDIPEHPESYVHRIGRTARAGREGVAISFCDNSERDALKDIEKTIGLKLPVDESHPFHGVKASAEARSSLDKRERPRSGYKTVAKPRPSGEREPSFFSKNRRWKTDGNNGGRAARPSFSDSKKPEFGGERGRGTSFNDRPREDRFKGERAREDRPREDRFREDRFREDRPRENRPREDRFGKTRDNFSDRRSSPSNARSERPRSYEDRKSLASFGDRKPRFSTDGNSERPARRDFNNDRSSFSKSSFGDNNHRFEFGEARSERPAFKERRPSFDRDKKPSFEGEYRGSKSFSNSDRKPSFAGKFGKKFGNKNNNPKPSRPKK